jgi:hypoxanthine-DNA glycosylase
MTETHPFGNFVPKNSRYLLLGSFTAKDALQKGYDWFYANGRNQFWPIIEEVYDTKLPKTLDKQKLFSDLKIAITDIILSCDRKVFNSSDMNLINIIFNREALEVIFKENKVQKVYFSSRFVENLFRRNFKDLTAKYPETELVTLPSPSPRYAKVTRREKIEIYKNLLPKIIL